MVRLLNPIHGLIPPDTIPLGFGCGGLLSDIGKKESFRLLETAIDCGITYFDTARMYGFGDAETLLGGLIRRGRHRVIVASKAGILPANRSIPLRVVNRGVKLLHKLVSPTVSLVPAPTSLNPRFGQFKMLDLRKSVETSLKKLHTDYLDILLLHECTAGDVQGPELKLFLDRLQHEGKIRAFGIATGIAETIRIMESRPYLGSVLQIPSSIWDMNIKRIPSNASGHTITHSTLTRRFHALAQQLMRDDTLAAEWALALQIDPRNKQDLALLLLAHALYSNPGGMVLFFSTKPEHVHASAKIAAEASFDPPQLIMLEKLMRRQIRSASPDPSM